MIDTNISILSTRHLSENSIEEAAWAGIHIDVTPFIQVEIREDEALLESLAALAQSPILAVCTSRYAIQALQELIPEPPQSWKIACTNGKTAAEAIEWLGEDALVATGPNAATLAAQLTGLQSSAPVVFFCGDQRLDHLPEALRKNDIPFEERIVYQTTATPVALDVRHYKGFLFFSPSAVHSFFSVNTLPFGATIFTIGATTAAAVTSYTFHNTVVSPQPDEQVLLDEVINHYNEERLIN